MNAIDGMKICSRCRVNKLTSEFHKKRQTTDGTCLYCKDCKGRIDAKARLKRISKMNSDELFKESVRRNQYKSKYRIAIDEYEAMYMARHGICDVCGKPDKATETGDTSRTRSPKHLMIDHDHTTGEVRGLIHHTCNIMLGIFNDDPEIIENAAEYLERHQTIT